jgi:restriction endonuclease S subunit
MEEENKLVSDSSKRVQLKDVCELHTGYDFKNEDLNEDNVFFNSFPILYSHNMSGRNVDLEDLKYVDFNKKYENFKVSENDIIISLTGDNLGLPILFTHTNFLISDHLAFIRIKGTVILPKFLFYCMRTYQFEDFISSATTGITTHILDLSKFLTCEIPLPNLKIQQTIIDSLEKKESEIIHFERNITRKEEEIEELLNLNLNT